MRQWGGVRAICWCFADAFGLEHVAAAISAALGHAIEQVEHEQEQEQRDQARQADAPAGAGVEVDIVDSSKELRVIAGAQVEGIDRLPPGQARTNTTPVLPAIVAAEGSYASTDIDGARVTKIDEDGTYAGAGERFFARHPV